MRTSVDSTDRRSEICALATRDLCRFATSKQVVEILTLRSESDCCYAPTQSLYPYVARDTAPLTSTADQSSSRANLIFNEFAGSRSVEARPVQNHSNTWPLYFRPGQYIPEEYSPIARSGDDLPEDNSLLLSSSPKVEPHRPSRPPNAWILFRVDRCKERKRLAPEILTQGELSKLLSQEWKDISPIVSKIPNVLL